MLTYWAFRIASLVLVALPLAVGYRLASIGGELAYLFCAGIRKNVKTNLRRVLGPEVDERTLATVSRGVFKTGVKNYFEMLRMPGFTAEHFRRRVRPHGLEHLDAALSKGRGAVMVSAHFGSFESTAQILTVLDYRLMVPVEPIKPPELLEFVSRMRATHGLEIVPAERGVMRQVIRWLRSNGVVGYPVDRDAVGGGLPFEFFGAETCLQPTAIALARRERCPVVPAFAVRQADNSSDIYIEPPLEMQVTEDENADLQANMQAMLRIFERYLRTYPDQWVAFVPIWKGTERQDVQDREQVESPEPVGQGGSTHP
jgi:KDO2-lipid IV(A) lauroyltransferase